MRGFAARHVGDPRTLLFMAPGWTIQARAGKGGLQYLDYRGQTVR